MMYLHYLAIQESTSRHSQRPYTASYRRISYRRKQKNYNKRIKNESHIRVQ
ncbi:hypothetical protein Hanom_Chr09g00818571 [Helianthus anomalus]